MAYTNIGTWKPTKATQKIFDICEKHIDSVPYKVSLRWVFYRLLQAGIYSKKSDYQCFSQIASRARHSGIWAPDILTDETREMVQMEIEGSKSDPDIDRLVTDGIDEAESEKNDLADRLEYYSYSSYYTVDPNCSHDYICVVMFEARAMKQQFATYAQGLTLCPFGGQPSIPFKYEIAQYLSRIYEWYDEKPLRVLYFGDRDDAGGKIYKTGREDISKWCAYPVAFEYCGLTAEQATAYDVPVNPDKPDSFQWEALTDEQAREIITDSIARYVDIDGAKREARAESLRIRSEVEERVNAALEDGG